ncbi:TolC family protein, partial [Acinetobacter baumannii]
MSIFLYEKRFVSLSSSWVLKSLVVAVALSASVITTAASSNQNLAENTQAQRVQNVLTFDQVLDQVKQFQTQTGIWQAQQDIADSNIKQSQLWENPTVSVQQTGFNSGKDQELELGISQKLDIFGVRSAAKKLATVQQNQVELNQVLYEAQLKLAVKYLWSQVSILELQHEVAKAQLRTSQNFLD